MTLEKPTPPSKEEQNTSLTFADAFMDGHRNHRPGSPSNESTSGKHCAISPVYQALVTHAARHIYDPSSLPPLPELVKKHTCDAKTNRGAMAAADREIHRTGDPFNQVKTPEEAKQAEHLETGVLERSIGAQLQSFEPHRGSTQPSTVIDAVLPNSPAAKAHLERGDAIAKINGIDARKMGSDEIQDLIGSMKKNVNLTLIRQGAEIHKTLVPEKRDLSSVDDPVDKGDGIAYIRVREFAGNTDKQLQDAMNKMPAAKAFVIDLRENGGGIMDSAIRGSELFIDQGDIMTARGRDESDPAHPEYSLSHHAVTPTKELTSEWKDGTPEPKPEESDRLPNVLGNRKLYVLQNENSASAAEIMLGALHDTAHAKTLGEPSFGKGIFQLDAPNVAAGATVHVTNGIYKTPSGHWPGDANKHKHPIHPDKQVSNPPRTLLDSPHDHQLHEVLKLARQELRNTP
jgi:C-terminal peptidase prc